MSTAWIPEPERVDFNSDFEVFANSAAREALSQMNPPRFIQGIISEDEGWFWQSAPSDTWEFDMLGVFGKGHPPEPYSNLPVLPQMMDNPQMLMPWMPLGSLEFCGGVLADPLPPTPRLGTIPLPLVDPWYNGGGYFGGGGGGGDDGGDGDFSGGRTGDHQSNGQWTAASDRQSEASTCLAPAKPIHIENYNRSEQSNKPTPPSSRSGYNRALNADEKTRRLAQIRGALGIPSTEGEIPTLLKIIQYLGGTAPKFEKPPVWLLKSQRQARKLGERRECFEELRSLVGPWTTKLYELKILNNVFAKVTSRTGKIQGPHRRYEPYGVFRA